MGKPPEAFQFSGDRALISAAEQEVQPIINYFKGWLPNANRVYADRIRRERLEAEERERRRIRAEIEEQEKRARLLKSVKI
jgi:hypothetical protein